MKTTNFVTSEPGKLLLLVLALLLLLTTVHPDDAPLLVLFFPFILIFTIGYKTLVFLFRQPFFAYVKKPRFFAATISGFLLSLLLLKSINQLSLQDVALLVLLASVAGFYIQHNGFGERS